MVSKGVFEQVKWERDIALAQLKELGIGLGQDISGLTVTVCVLYLPLIKIGGSRMNKEGLRQKYIVMKAETGETVDNCFVLRPTKDEAAKIALKAYAEATTNKTLANDLKTWLLEVAE